MIPQNKYIIFHVPSTQRDLTRPRYPSMHRKCKYNSGNYNKRLVCDILLYNGIQSAVSDKDRKVAIYWGTCLEVSNQQISLYGNGNGNGYNNHNINTIINGPANNYAGNIENINILHKYNHFPNSKFFLGNKAEFAYIIQKNPAYDSFPRFLPLTYILPRDRDALFKAMRSHPSACYIAKPPGGSCGNGIKLVTYSDFYYISPNSVVSEYIARPLCIDGFKFDLRVYVLVTSFCPLRAFVAKEGLTRFATESYSSSSANIYSHLTNATLNKKGRHWENGAFKWKMSELIQEVAYRWSNQNSKGNFNGTNSRDLQKNAQNQIMDKILSTIAMTLAFVQPTMCPKERKRLLDPCFELYGFDIIFDRNVRPYVLEVNTMPSLNTDEDVDYEVKAPLLAQAFSIAGIPDMTSEQLQDAVKNFRLPPGGVKQFDAEIVKQEDERNRLSGEGFIRIFPSEKYASKFEHILLEPKLHPKLQSQLEQSHHHQPHPQPPTQDHSPQPPPQPSQPSHQPPTHFIAKEVASSGSNDSDFASKSIKPSVRLESQNRQNRQNQNQSQAASTMVKTIHQPQNPPPSSSSTSQTDQKSKTLPSLAFSSPQAKPSTSGAASRIKVSGSASRVKPIGQETGGGNGGGSNNTRTIHTNRKIGEESRRPPSTAISSSQAAAASSSVAASSGKANNGSGSIFSQEVGSAVLALYLGKVEMRLRATGDPRLAARAQCFLVAQGYRVARGVAGVRALLQHYAGQVKSWAASSAAAGRAAANGVGGQNQQQQQIGSGGVGGVAGGGYKSAIPEKLKNELMAGDDETFKKILTSCDLPMVKNIRLLFK